MLNEICKIYAPDAEIKLINTEDTNLYINAVHNRNVQAKKNKQYIALKIITFTAVWLGILSVGLLSM